MRQLTILDIQDKMKAGELTARKLTEYYLDRITKLDRIGPRLNAVIEINPDALAIADVRDTERSKGRVRGLLHGIPVLIKANIETHDRMQTTAGSLALEGHIASRDAFLVKQLRKAGAIILGKTNLSEWANFRGRNSTSGWSSIGGLTRNPHALDRSAGGSSSGSGAAVAADFCTAAVGTETIGSIISPSQANGIVGLKPTPGLIGRTGLIPVAPSLDTAGPMARSITDAAIVLGAMTGTDARDSATKYSHRRGSNAYHRELDEAGLQGARIGVLRQMSNVNPRILEVFESSLDAMRRSGAVIVDPVDIPAYSDISRLGLEPLFYEFKASINEYLASARPRMRVGDLKDLIRFNEENRSRVMPFFGQEMMLLAQSKGPLTSRKYRAALAKSERLIQEKGMNAVMKQHSLDAIVAPSGELPCLIDLINGDSLKSDSGAMVLAAIARCPHMTVPAGFVFGLPVSVSFIAGAWQERTLFRLGFAFEQATRSRLPPRFLPTVDPDDA